MVARVEGRSETSNVNHLFHNVQLYGGSSSLALRAMIDSGSPFNLLSQDLIVWHQILGDSTDIPPARDLNGAGICLFQRHKMAVATRRIDNVPTLDAIDVFGANIAGCKLILGLPWLRTAQPQIGWYENTVSFAHQEEEPFSEEAAAIRSQVIGVHNVNAPSTPSSSGDDSDSAPVVACVSLVELAEICDTEGTEAFMVE